MSRLILVLDNLRSCHNVGSIIRTANGFGQYHFVFLGLTPYPTLKNDQRLPWQAAQQSRRIAKTSLGTENAIQGQYFPDENTFLKTHKPQNIICLEQTATSQNLADYHWPDDACLIVGNELNGVSKNLLQAAQTHLYIPMLGHKESFNVAVALGIGLYQYSLQMS